MAGISGEASGGPFSKSGEAKLMGQCKALSPPDCP